ncbi:hypothetical protein HZC07_03780 [Candidatus Micrarchaeota archaeon]|nr:hypothetical protein [Candidatus Micrarchaeota archaeon]
MNGETGRARAIAETRIDLLRFPAAVDAIVGEFTGSSFIPSFPCPNFFAPNERVVFAIAFEQACELCDDPEKRQLLSSATSAFRGDIEAIHPYLDSPSGRLVADSVWALLDLPPNRLAQYVTDRLIPILGCYSSKLRAEFTDILAGRSSPKRAAAYISLINEKIEELRALGVEIELLKS